MDEWGSATEIIAATMSLIADQSIGTFRWTEMSQHENAQVPVYWVGDPAKASLFGAFPKTAGPPSIRRLEKWLRSKVGAQKLSGGKGSHARWKLPNGHKVTFATAQGFLLPPEAKQLALALGLTTRELFAHIAAMRKPPALVPSHARA
jgi:hypothetical protein